jgi:UPF0716 protein FxsA
MRKLLLVFILIPALELVLLIEIGKRIGTLETLALIVVTGVLGAALARRQGLGVIRAARAEAAAGRLPAAALVDGLIILLAGAVLITPGVLTDIFGFLCLIPISRRWIKTLVGRWLLRAAQDGRVRVSVSVNARGSRPARPHSPGESELRRPPDRRLEP